MNSQEINIYDFLKITLTQIIKYSLKWKKLFIIFILLGLFAGSSFYYLKKENYKAKFLARSYSGYYYEINENIRELGFLVANSQKLSEALNISESAASSIQEIYSDTIDNHVIFVEVRYKGDLNLNEVESGIVSYIDNNPFLSESIELNRIKLLDLRDELISEVEELDSLQNIIINNLKNENSANKSKQLVINNKEIDFYQNDVLERKKELFILNKEIKELSALKIIKPITQIKLRYYSLIIVLLVSVLCSLGLALLLSGFLEIRKLLK